MLSWQQKYSIASSLANNSPQTVKNNCLDNKEAIEFVDKIAKYYKKLNGYVPKQVINIINDKNI